MVSDVEVDLLGAMCVRRGGEALSLPSSRKTRALLAYLLVTDKEVRRDRLCDLFWEVPDDPRGALRWSLSKLRSLVDTTDQKRLKTNRDAVRLEIPDHCVDWRRLRTLTRSGVHAAPTEALRHSAQCGTFLEGLELPGCEAFNAWCIAQREDVRVWRIAVLDELTSRPIDADEAIELTRAWTMLDSFSAKPWERLVHLLRHSERLHEAEQQRSLAIKMLREAGRLIPSTLQAPRQGRELPPEVTRPRLTTPLQELRFCRSSDGTRLAFATLGQGPPLVCAGYWMNHLENDVSSPIWRPWIERAASAHTLVRYDIRGFGLSDRNVELHLDRFVADLEAVVDSANLESFDLYGMAQGAVTAVMYAVRHPGRVRRLVLQSSYAVGWLRRNDAQEVERRKAMITLATSGWGQDNQGLRRMFVGLYLPSGDDEQVQWFDAFFRSMMGHRNIESLQRLLGDVDIRRDAVQVSVPTLVLHARGEMIIPFAAGREMATLIPAAHLVTLDSSSHLIVETEPAWARMMEAVDGFLDS